MLYVTELMYKNNDTKLGRVVNKTGIFPVGGKPTVNLIIELDDDINNKLVLFDNQVTGLIIDRPICYLNIIDVDDVIFIKVNNSGTELTMVNARTGEFIDISEGDYGICFK